MSDTKSYNYVNNLSYKEAAELDENNKKKLADTAKQNLFAQISSNTYNDGVEFDRAYRLQIKLIDGMNVVAKCEEIPILETIIKTPDMNGVPIHYKKLNLKQRLQILFKGEI